jgi:hypothetical protein
MRISTDERGAQQRPLSARKARAKAKGLALDGSMRADGSVGCYTAGFGGSALSGGEGRTKVLVRAGECALCVRVRTVRARA